VALNRVVGLQASRDGSCVEVARWLIGGHGVQNDGPLEALTVIVQRSAFCPWDKFTPAIGFAS